MAFRERFDRYVCEGDSIDCEIDGFRVTARIVRDDCPDAPDKRQDGFWPSLYINDPGFIGPGNNFRARLAKAQAEAEAVMEAWRKDEWFYCGVVLTIECEGVELESHAASLCRAQHKLAYVASIVMWSCCAAALILRSSDETPLNIIAKLLPHSAEGDRSCVQHFHDGLKSRPCPGQ
ncbi:hypothetical protein, partial [Hyphomonas chukchiensis]|uniref:hypothetical protein n=1 Tax=Hyphomonas chukchiensis TaxID=1280947 RepID=UPI0019D6BA07